MYAKIKYPDFELVFTKKIYEDSEWLLFRPK